MLTNTSLALFRSTNSNDNKDWKGIWSKFFVAQASALSAAYLSFPLDSIRRAQQRHPEKSVWEIINIIFEVGGMSGFFYGSLQNAIRTVTSALVLVLQGVSETSNHCHFF